MSRTRHARSSRHSRPFWDRTFSPTEHPPLADVDEGLGEYIDHLSCGRDYASEFAEIQMTWSSKWQHHRGRRRSATTRKCDKWAKEDRDDERWFKELIKVGGVRYSGSFPPSVF